MLRLSYCQFAARRMKGQDASIAPKIVDAMSLDEIIAHRSALLTDYQNAKLTKRYLTMVKQMRDAARSATG